MAGRLHLCSLLLVAIGTTTILGQFLDISECSRCDSQYSSWVRNRTSGDYWDSFNSSTEAADHSCQWTAEIYHNCYSNCAKDADGNIVPHTSTRKAVVLKNYIDKYCLEGACRLADIQICSYSPYRAKCDPEYQACVSTKLSDKGCMEKSLSSPGERRAYAQNILDTLSCHLSYPDNKANVREATPAEDRGLQQCKDIIIVECLKSWSNDEYDLEHITNYSNGTKKDFCGAKKAAIQCLYGVTNGSVEYAAYNYSTPCKTELLKHPEHIDKARAQVAFAYEVLCANTTDTSDCSGSQPCSDEEISTDLPTTTGIVTIEDMKPETTTMGDPDLDTDKPNPEDKNTEPVAEKGIENSEPVVPPRSVHITDIHGKRDQDNSGARPVSHLLFTLAGSLLVYVAYRGVYFS